MYDLTQQHDNYFETNKCQCKHISANYEMIQEKRTKQNNDKWSFQV